VLLRLFLIFLWILDSQFRRPRLAGQGGLPAVDVRKLRPSFFFAASCIIFSNASRFATLPMPPIVKRSRSRTGHHKYRGREIETQFQRWSCDSNDEQHWEASVNIGCICWPASMLLLPSAAMSRWHHCLQMLAMGYLYSCFVPIPCIPFCV
jgi:hypothetical protein